jgi:GT2 family glycosyltransferase
VIRELGGWDERLRVNQDFEFDYRVRASGRELLFDPELRIDWESRQSIGALYSQYRRYGHGKVRVARLHPGSVRPRHLMAPALVAELAVAVVVAARRPGRAALLVAPYLAALAVASARTARELDAESRPWVAPAFAAMHVGWGLGFWRGVAEAARDRLRGTSDLR